MEEAGGEQGGSAVGEQEPAPALDRNVSIISNGTGERAASFTYGVLNIYVDLQNQDILHLISSGGGGFIFCAFMAARDINESLRATFTKLIKYSSTSFFTRRNGFYTFLDFLIFLGKIIFTVIMAFFNLMPFINFMVEIVVSIYYYVKPKHRWILLVASISITLGLFFLRWILKTCKRLTTKKYNILKLFIFIFSLFSLFFIGEKLMEVLQNKFDEWVVDRIGIALIGVWTLLRSNILCFMTESFGRLVNTVSGTATILAIFGIIINWRLSRAENIFSFIPYSDDLWRIILGVSIQIIILNPIFSLSWELLVGFYSISYKKTYCNDGDNQYIPDDAWIDSNNQNRVTLTINCVATLLEMNENGDSTAGIYFHSEENEHLLYTRYEAQSDGRYLLVNNGEIDEITLAKLAVLSGSTVASNVGSREQSSSLKYLSTLFNIPFGVWLMLGTSTFIDSIIKLFFNIILNAIMFSSAIVYCIPLYGNAYPFLIWIPAILLVLLFIFSEVYDGPHLVSPNSNPMVIFLRTMLDAPIVNSKGDYCLIVDIKGPDPFHLYPALEFRQSDFIYLIDASSDPGRTCCDLKRSIAFASSYGWKAVYEYPLEFFCNSNCSMRFFEFKMINTIGENKEVNIVLLKGIPKKHPSVCDSFIGLFFMNFPNISPYFHLFTVSMKKDYINEGELCLKEYLIYSFICSNYVCVLNDNAPANKDDIIGHIKNGSNNQTIDDDLIDKLIFFYILKNELNFLNITNDYYPLQRIPQNNTNAGNA